MNRRMIARMLAAVAVLPVGLAGCMGPMRTADGRQAYVVYCNGASSSWDKCQAEAAKLCPANGYDVLERSDQTAAARRMAGGGDGFGNPIDANRRSMKLACKAN